MKSLKVVIVKTLQEYELARRGAIWAVLNDSGEKVLGIMFRCPGCGYPGQVPVVYGTEINT